MLMKMTIIIIIMIIIIVIIIISGTIIYSGLDPANRILTSQFTGNLWSVRRVLLAFYTEISATN